MTPRQEPTPEDLAASRVTRIQARRLAHQESYLSLLRMAERKRKLLGAHTAGVQQLIQEGDAELRAILSASGGRIEPRRRPLHKDLTRRCRVFLDECGSHNLAAKEEFDAFALAAVIVPEPDYRELDRRWRAWKATNLGSEQKVVHEPDVRKGRGAFWCHGSRAQRVLLNESLRKVLRSLDFTAIVCVVNRPAYLKEIGNRPLDESLPGHLYLMALNFFAERLVMALDRHFQGARGKVVAESRGLLEDAALQYEYVRLQLDGTSYVSASWFRHQLVPAIEFAKKQDNISGLQMADLLARPCAEKVLDPSSRPDRWPEFREKLCPRQETAHSIIGLKIVPWAEKYAEIWKS